MRITYLVFASFLKNSMNESTNGFLAEKWRRRALVGCCIAMIAALLLSRAVLSATMMLFIVLSLVHPHVRRQWKVFISAPVFWSTTLLFLIPMMSGLWSTDTHAWRDILRIKLPLLILPFCFAATVFFTQKDWRLIASTFILVTLLGVGWSTINYMMHAREIHRQYLLAGALPTPLQNDHVRFSLQVAIAALLALFLIQRKGHSGKWLRIILWVAIALFAGYLHLLAARTGLFCFYLGVAGLLIARIRRTGNRKFVFAFIMVLALPVAAYMMLPTFRNRIHYIQYDLRQTISNIYEHGANDGNRFASIKAGLLLMEEEPLTGVGFGDIARVCRFWYEVHYPAMTERDYILPSSEWVLYGAGAGWLAVMLFTFVMLAPFFVVPLRRNVFWVLLNVFFACSYVFDIGLEVQYGIFLHCLLVFSCFHWFKHDT